MLLDFYNSDIWHDARMYCLTEDSCCSTLCQHESKSVSFNHLAVWKFAPLKKTPTLFQQFQLWRTKSSDLPWKLIFLHQLSVKYGIMRQVVLPLLLSRFSKVKMCEKNIKLGEKFQCCNRKWETNKFCRNVNYKEICSPQSVYSLT